jgi:polyhydroxybutyrate depolymerase
MNRHRRTRPPARLLAGLVVAASVTVAACSSSAAGPAPSATAVTQGAIGTSPTIAGATTASRASRPSVGCAATTVVPPGTTDERITSGGEQRSYQLIVPEGYDGTEPLPIVFGLHSLTVDYRIVPGMSGFADLDGTYDFIGVAPSGRLSNGRSPYWNAAPAEDNYDLVFLTELLDHLEDVLCVDTGRVFSVGMSNGAQTSSLLACRLGDRIAGIAPIAGVEHNEPCDGPPVPVIAFHGFEDPIVPYAGGGLNSVTIANQNFYKGALPAGLATPTGVDESMARWAEHNGCDPEPVEERVSPEVRKQIWSNCDAPTVLYIVDNGGHAWPGKPQPAFEASFGHGTTEIDASTLLFEFFFDNEV